MKLIKYPIVALANLIKSTIAIFSKRDAIIIAFFTLVGIGGVFAAGLITVSAPDTQGAGYIAATTCDPAVTINKNVVFDTVSKRYVVTTISLSNVDQRYDPNGVNGCGNRVIEMAIPINGVINYTSWSIPSSSVSSSVFTISSGVGCSRYDSNSPTISIDSTLLNNLAFTIKPGTTSIEDDDYLQIKYSVDEYDSYSGSGNTIYDQVSGKTINTVLDTAQNGTITNTSAVATDSRGVKYLTMSQTNGSYIFTVSTPQSTAQSIYFWIYPLDLDSNGVADPGVIYDEVGSSGVWHDAQIEVVNGKVRFNRWAYSTSTPDQYVIESALLSPNQWHLVGVSGTSSTLSAYIDGSLVSSVSQPWTQNGGAITHGIGAPDTTNLGGNPEARGTNGDFRFNSFYLFGKALSSAEVTALYNYTKNCKR
jgi:Concanavalin A-like lectin/glucanases superfamily